jgi:hypothetical protein
MWLLIILYVNVAFVTVVETEAMCEAVVRQNLDYWQATGQKPQAGCFKTFEI